MTAENVFRLCEVVTIVAGLTTLLALVGSVISGRALSKQQEVQIAQLKLDLEKERNRGLDLERSAMPRPFKFNCEAFRKRLKGQPTGTAEILFPAEDVETYELASQIVSCLTAEGWSASCRPVQESDAQAGIDKNAPLCIRAGLGVGGIGFVTREPQKFKGPFEPNAAHILHSAFTSGKSIPGQETSSAFLGSYNPNLPVNFVRLILGPKFGEW